MKAIILSAWQWTRLKPITNEIPKPMVRILNKPILEYIIENIYSKVDEIIIVVWYKPEAIINYFWDNYKWTKITYHYQVEDKKWTGSAIMWINIPKDTDIFLMYWDSIFEKEDLAKILDLKWYWCLVKEVTNPEKYWIFKQDENGFAIKIIEKPSEFVWNLASLGVYKFNYEIFELVYKIELSTRWEYELTDALNLFLKNNKFKLEKIEWKFIDITTSEDIGKAEVELMKSVKIWESLFLQDFSDFELCLWLEKNNLEELIAYSTDKNDLSLQENTSDLKRFSTKENFNNWYNDKDRYVFTLLSVDKELAWIIWFRPCEMPEIKEIVNNELFEKMKNWFIHTSWIRVYPKFRWKWLAKLLLSSSEFYRKIFKDAIICVDIDKENIASQKSFEKAWYQFLGYWENKKTVEALDEPRMLYVDV